MDGTHTHGPVITAFSRIRSNACNISPLISVITDRRFTPSMRMGLTSTLLAWSRYSIKDSYD